MQLLNDEQIKTLAYLYQHSGKSFNTTSMREVGLTANRDDLNDMANKDLINQNRQNEQLNNYSITAGGRAYYEQHLKLLDEEKRHKEYEEKILAESQKANVISQAANNISKTSNKYAAIALIVSVISAAATIFSLIITLLCA